MADNTGHLTIGAFAKAAGVNVETIRFYQRKGLLPEPERPAGSIRRYGSVDVDRVRFVKSAQRLGFSLAEVAQLLRLEDGARCDDAATIAARHLDDVCARLDDLQRIKVVLSALLHRCRSHADAVSCPLIASLQHADETADSLSRR